MQYAKCYKNFHFNIASDVLNVTKHIFYTLTYSVVKQRKFFTYHTFDHFPTVQQTKFYMRLFRFCHNFRNSITIASMALLLKIEYFLLPLVLAMQI